MQQKRSQQHETNEMANYKRGEKASLLEFVDFHEIKYADNTWADTLAHFRHPLIKLHSSNRINEYHLLAIGLSQNSALNDVILLAASKCHKAEKIYREYISIYNGSQTHCMQCD